MRSVCVPVLAFSILALASPARSLDLGGGGRAQGSLGTSVGGAVGGVGRAVGGTVEGAADGLGRAVGTSVGQAGNTLGGNGSVGGAVGGAISGIGESIGNTGAGVGAAVGSGLSGGVSASTGASSGAAVSTGAGQESSGTGEVGRSLHGGVSTARSATRGSVTLGSEAKGGLSATENNANSGQSIGDTADRERLEAMLPSVLRPVMGGLGRSTRNQNPLEEVSGVSLTLIENCRAAIETAARPLGAIKVAAVSAGKLKLVGRQSFAPLKVVVKYARLGGTETRQAKVSCRLNSDGNVLEVI